MVTIVDGIEGRISRRLRERREVSGFSQADLAARSGVSRAMIGKIEAGISSPTAALLGRLCAALGVTLSTLMLDIEQSETTFFPAATQPTWKDPATGLVRTLIAPSTALNDVEIARLWLPGGTVVDYPDPPERPIRQHIMMLSGQLSFTIGEETTMLHTGDCLFAIINRPTRFEVPGRTPAEYFVTQAPA